MVWRTPEGFSVKPYYRAEHLKGLEYLNTPPGTFPYTRTSKSENNVWEIRQDIGVENAENANMRALEILEKGVNSIGFRLNSGTVASQDTFSQMLKDIYLECISLHLLSGDKTPDYLEFLVQEAKKRNIPVEKLNGSFDFDPFAHLCAYGNYYDSKQFDFIKAKDILTKGIAQIPHFKMISANGALFNKAGASILQELAFTLAIGCEYVTGLTELGLKAEEIIPRIQFTFGIGSNYFMEIAKLRAARLLWAKIAESYGVSTEKAVMHIHSVTSEWNKTLFDPHVNLLRATTEAMSATLGGTGSLEVTPFDTPFADESEFSSRIARNIQIILKEEAHFDKVIDPAAGSYYIENLTNSIIEHAWDLFLEVDKQGGFSKAFETGFIQEKINHNASQRRK
ncbi:MAG: hypothetical protein HC906_09835 [Bacteroidales bacterium]|nr:hypothetical protein [Bacteroidales bacterium]